MGQRKKTARFFKWNSKSHQNCVERSEANNQVLHLGFTRSDTAQPEQSAKVRSKCSHRFFTCNWVAATSRTNSFCKQYGRPRRQSHQLSRRFPVDSSSSDESSHENHTRKFNEIGLGKSKDVVGVTDTTTVNATDISVNWNAEHLRAIDFQPKILYATQNLADEKGYYESDRYSSATLAQQTDAKLEVSLTNDQLNYDDRQQYPSSKSQNNNRQQLLSLQSNVHSPRDYLRNSQKKLANKPKSTNRTSVVGCLPRCTARNNSCEPELVTNSVKSSFRQKNNSNIKTDTAKGHLNCKHRHSKQSLMNNWCNAQDMDRSVDSIGSCSLDVDAESTDFSDTSGSLNLCTPLSGKDFTREFTSRIHERCQVIPPTLQTQQQKTTTILDPTSGKISTVLASASIVDQSPQTSPVKKPSYLNLACCVNGYSILTTYDSKFRQNINKSREVSPIRPITHTLQYNRGDSNYLVVPVPVPTNGHTNNRTFMMDKQTILSPEKRYVAASSTGTDMTDNVHTNGIHRCGVLTSATTISQTFVRDEAENGKSTKSFIQQRVERLYGASALAQGLYSPKKPKSDGANAQVLSEKSQNSPNQLKEHSLATVNAVNGLLVDVENVDVNGEALPVLRHLRPEFRAQLPTLSSPKRANIFLTKLKSPEQSRDENATTVATNGHAAAMLHTKGKLSTTTSKTTTKTSTIVHAKDLNEPNFVTTRGHCAVNGLKSSVLVSVATEVLDKLKLTEKSKQNDSDLASPKLLATLSAASSPTLDRLTETVLEVDAVNEPVITSAVIDSNGNHKTEEIMDGAYFLKIVQRERERLIDLAVIIEKDIEVLMQNPEADDDLLGCLRSASGKARLLSTQKFRQFEGLCQHNLEQTVQKSIAPPTTQDLQGFWDLVMLQVDHVDSLFAEIDTIRANNWTRPQKQPTKLAPKRTIPSRTGGAAIKPTFTKSTTANSTDKSSASIAAAQKREAQRKLLLEMKRKNKMAMTTTPADATVADNNHTNETDR